MAFTRSQGFVLHRDGNGRLPDLRGIRESGATEGSRHTRSECRTGSDEARRRPTQDSSGTVSKKPFRLLLFRTLVSSEEEIEGNRLPSCLHQGTEGTNSPRGSEQISSNASQFIPEDGIESPE